MGDDTDTRTVRVHNDTWMRLHALKNPGETFDSVIKRALSESDLKSGLLEQLKEEDETEAAVES